MIIIVAISNIILLSSTCLQVRVAGVRTVIVLLNQRNLNLMEVTQTINQSNAFLLDFQVTEEVARLDKSSFGSVCLL